MTPILLEPRISHAYAIGFLAATHAVVFWSVIIALTAYKLAAEKERNVALWTILGAIPPVNFVTLAYFVGAANLRLERNIDELSQRLGIAW